MVAARSLCQLGLYLLLLQQALGIKIEDKPRDTQRTQTTNSSTTKAPPYRVSRPEPKQAEKRVPPHLQDVRPGYVDDDAGDVIRIIEPPVHFQQLKRQRQRQSPPQHLQRPTAPVVWEQPRKLSTNRAPVPPARPKLVPAKGDLLTQETQYSPQTANNLQLPVEILASVRKTERLLQRQRQKAPLLRQRHIQRQTHTLITQKSHDQQLYQRGQQQRLRATLTQEHKRSKRVKRAAEAGHYDVAHGLKLVARITELLENATRYLPDELEPNELAPSAAPLTLSPATASASAPAPSPVSSEEICGNATKCDSRRRRQRLFKQQGPKKTVVRGRNFRHEATTKAPATITTTIEANARLAATTTTNSSTTTSATPLASRLVNSRKSQNNHNQHPKKQKQKPKLTPSPSPSPRSDDSILYADVMSNIRNLWQEHDHDHDQQLMPQFVAPPQLGNSNSNKTNNHQALHVYLRELDDISKRLPSVAPLTDLRQEQQLIEAPASANWYLINDEGKIYETHLDIQSKPTAAIFHRFPDMPEDNKAIISQDLELK